MKINIKKTKKVDFPFLAEVYAREFSKPPYNEKWTNSLAIKKLKLLSKYCEIYSVFFETKLVGFFAVNATKLFPGKTIEGEEFAIDSDYQGRGIGKYCLNWLEKEFTKRGYENFIFLSIRASPAYKIYKNLGYKESEIDALFYKELK